MAGSYEALEAGNTGDALVDFTGGVCESINLKDGGYNQDLEKRQALFKSMERAMREKSLISASIRVSTQMIGLFQITEWYQVKNWTRPATWPNKLHDCNFWWFSEGYTCTRIFWPIAISNWCRSVKIIWNPRLFNVLYMNCNHIIYIHMYYSHCVFGEVYPPDRFNCGNVIWHTMYTCMCSVWTPSSITLSLFFLLDQKQRWDGKAHRNWLSDGTCIWCHSSEEGNYSVEQVSL